MPRIQIKDWPPRSPKDLNRREGAILAAKLMMNAAITAPVTGGIPEIEGEIVWGEEEQDALARKMEELAYERPAWTHIFLLEAQMARESDCILFVGNYRAHITPWGGECGSCAGRPNCSYLYENRKHIASIIEITDRRSDKLVNGPLCALYAHNTGYAVGSALMAAVRLYVDTRPFMSMGLAAQKLGYCPNSFLVVGVSISARQKSEVVDRGFEYETFNLEKHVDSIRKQVGAGWSLSGSVDIRHNKPPSKRMG